MNRHICKIERTFQPGSHRPSEDQLICSGDLFGVFDGASSLVPELYQGQTGAWWASYLVSEEFAKNNGPLHQLSRRANSELRKTMLNEGVAVEDKLACWSTSLAVVRVEESLLEWVQIGDSHILAIEESGHFRLLTHYHNHDSRTLLQLKSLFSQNNPDPHKALLPYIEGVRQQMNLEYGVLNGDLKAFDFLENGHCALNDIRHLLIFTDGLLPPAENPDEDHDFQWLVDLYLQGGLSLVQEQIRQKENSDPECRHYPRFKKHDDIAAIALTLN